MELFHVSIDPMAIELATNVLQSGWLNEGKYALELESKLKMGIFDSIEKILQLNNPITVNSCTSALHLSLLCSGVGPGDEVILPAQTFVATGTAILMCGAKPVFADIDPETGCLNPKKIEKKITDKTKALIFVYWAGNTPLGKRHNDLHCASTGIIAICKKHNIFFIEDAAHALGSKFMMRGYKAVTVGGKPVIGANDKYLPDFTCFSLQAIKFVTSGDGGILCVHNDEMVDRVKKMKWFGLDKNAPRRPEGDRSSLISELGFKYNMNDLTAAVALGNFSKIMDRITTRYTHTSFYDKNLINVPGVTLLKKSKLSKPCNWVYTIKVDGRINFINKMKSCGIPVSVLDRRIDEHPIFGGITEGLTGQEEFDKSQISIPVHEALTQEDLDLIVKSIKEGW